MKNLKQLISNNSEKFGEFTYYLLHIEKIENNIIIHPDIAIETCKAMIEGICKTILFRLNRSYDEMSVKEWVFQRIFSTSVNLIAENDNTFEADYIDNFKHIIKLLGEIRNKRGHISHGKSAPKNLNSSVEFAEFVEQFTSTILIYILKHFFNLRISLELKIEYLDNEDFNNQLDEITPLDGIVKYSKALYEQDYILYEDLLNEYNQNIEIKDNDDISDNSTKENSNIIIEAESYKNNNSRNNIPINASDEIDEKYNILLSRENSKESLKKICDDEKLYINEVLKLIETYKFDRRVPLSESILSTMKQKPKPLSRIKVSEYLKKVILQYVNEYIIEELNEQTI